MFDHYYVFEEDSDPDQPEPLVVEIGNLDAEKLRELPKYLVDTIDLRYNVKGLDTHLEARPIQFELSGGSKISERGIWALILDQPGGVSSVSRYVDAAIEHRPHGEVLGFYSFLDVVGQDPIYALISRIHPEYLIEEPKSLDEFIQASDCFLRFLRHCDMDHETYQNEYIDIVLGFYMKYDMERMVNLLAFRLTSGQYTDLRKDKVRFLLKNGAFKAVVDKLLDMGCWKNGWNYGDLFVLCSAVYGRSLELIEEVVQYCSDRENIGERQLDRYAQLDAERLAAYSDFLIREKVKYGEGVNTGFHRIKDGDETWVSIMV